MSAVIYSAGSHYGESPNGPRDFKSFKDLLDKKFKARFRTLIDIYPVSNDSFKGVEEIVAGLVKIALSNRYKKKLGIEEERPVSWLELEQKAKGLRTTVRLQNFQDLPLTSACGASLQLG